MNIRPIFAGFLARGLARCEREREQLLTPRFCIMATCLGLIQSVAVQFDSSQSRATRAFELLSLAIYLACALRLLVRFEAGLRVESGVAARRSPGS